MPYKAVGVSKGGKVDRPEPIIGQLFDLAALGLEICLDLAQPAQISEVAGPACCDADPQLRTLGGRNRTEKGGTLVERRDRFVETKASCGILGETQ